MSDVDPLSGAYCKQHDIYLCDECVADRVRLVQLAKKYCVDKYYAHSYMPIYCDLFASRKVQRLLEIGIGYENLMAPFVPRYVHGSSLRMWEEYWPEADIFACDIREETLINEDRIHSVVCDQSSVTSLYAMTKAFDSGHWDVIIDDGSHLPEDQIYTAHTLTVEPYLNKGGVYIIEDCREPEYVADAVNGKMYRFNKRPDDCLIVITK